MDWKVRILWFLFSITLIATSLGLVGNFADSWILAIPLIILLLHATWTLSFWRGILLITLACLSGFIFEYFGLRDGVIFGGTYEYLIGGIKIVTVPLSVILYWGVFIYLGFCLTNIVLPKKDFIFLPIKILLDVIFVVAIDLVMDPLQVKMGGWRWTNGGAYFGVPWGNFGGWVLVTATATGIFRTIVFLMPAKEKPQSKQLEIMPVFGYGLLLVNFFDRAIVFKIWPLVVIASLTMLPITLVSYFRCLKKVSIVL